MNMKELQRMMKEAQKMQEQLEAEMTQLKVEAGSGGGMVKVTMDGKKRLLTLSIDPSAVDPQDIEILQDLILAAVNSAASMVDEAMSAQMGNLSGGLLGGMR